VKDGAGSALAGGIFAQPSNIGTHESNRLAGVADLGARVGYRVADQLIPSYDALYVSSVIRPGDAMNPYINTTTTPLAAASRASGSAIPISGPAAPLANPGSTGVWSQTLSVGLTLRF
jgi:hypothetical protein